MSGPKPRPLSRFQDPRSHSYLRRHGKGHTKCPPFCAPPSALKKLVGSSRWSHPMTSGKFPAGDRRPFSWDSEENLMRVRADRVIREAAVGVEASGTSPTGGSNVTRVGRAVHRNPGHSHRQDHHPGKRGGGKKYPGLSLCPPSSFPQGPLIGCTQLLAGGPGSVGVWSLAGQPPRLKAERAGCGEGGLLVSYCYCKKSPPTSCLRTTHLSPLTVLKVRGPR